MHITDEGIETKTELIPSLKATYYALFHFDSEQ